MTVNRKYNMYHNILRRAISYLNEVSYHLDDTRYVNNRIEWAKEEIDIAMMQLTKLL